MMPILGESTEEDLKIAHVSTVEPYMLLVMDDSSIKMLKLDSQGELDELDLSGDLAESRWMSGSVHQKSTKGSDAMLYVVSDEGSLHVSKHVFLEDQSHGITISRCTIYPTCA